MLPDPPTALPDPPAAFYAALRQAAPDAEALEVDFGDSGVGVAFPGGVGAQVSRRAAVCFDAQETAHFDERSPGWTDAAAAWLAARVSSSPL